MNLRKPLRTVERAFWHTYVGAWRGYHRRNLDLEQTFRNIAAASEELNRRTSGVEPFIGFTVDGDALVMGKVAANVYALPQMNETEAYRLITALHAVGQPFRLIVVLRHAGGTGVTALSRRFQETEKSLCSRFASQLPAARHPWTWWKTQYLGYLKTVKAAQKTTETYIVLPVGTAVSELSDKRMLTGPELQRLAVLLLGFPWGYYELSREQLSQDQKYVAGYSEPLPAEVPNALHPGTTIRPLTDAQREAIHVQRMKKPLRLTMPASSYDLPQQMKIGKTGVRVASSTHAWHISGINIRKIQPLDELIPQVMPAVDADTTLAFLLTALPVAPEDNDGFISIARKRAADLERSFTPREGERNEIATEFLTDWWQMINDVSLRNRQGFECRLDLTVRTTAQDRLAVITQAILRLMGDGMILAERPKHWLEMADHLRNMIPGIDADIAEMAQTPVTDMRLMHALVGKTHKFSPKWIPIGMLLPEGTPFQLGPGVHVGIGGMGSGKSMMAKFAAAHLLATSVNPPHIYVYDGAGCPADDEQNSRTAGGQMKGWFDFMLSLGLGDAVVFADCYDAKTLKAKLRTLKDAPVVLFYPHDERPELDKVYFEWVGTMMAHHKRPRETSESDVDGLLVIDDALTLIGEVSERSRLRYLAEKVLTQTVANGFSCIITLQTPKAIEEAEATAFATLKGITTTWCIFSLSAFWSVAQEIGIADYIPAGHQLTEQIVKAMELVVPGSGTGVTETPGLGVAVFRTVSLSLVQTVASPDLIRLLERKNGGSNAIAS
jgi:hypothetical protein